jgi:hypothetical protein
MSGMNHDARAGQELIAGCFSDGLVSSGEMRCRFLTHLLVFPDVRVWQPKSMVSLGSEKRSRLRYSPFLRFYRHNPFLYLPLVVLVMM